MTIIGGIWKGAEEKRATKAEEARQRREQEERDGRKKTRDGDAREFVDAVNANQTKGAPVFDGADPTDPVQVEQLLEAGVLTAKSVDAAQGIDHDAHFGIVIPAKAAEIAEAQAAVRDDTPAAVDIIARLTRRLPVPPGYHDVVRRGMQAATVGLGVLLFGFEYGQTDEFFINRNYSSTSAHVFAALLTGASLGLAYAAGRNLKNAIREDGLARFEAELTHGQVDKNASRKDRRSQQRTLDQASSRKVLGASGVMLGSLLFQAVTFAMRLSAANTGDPLSIQAHRLFAVAGLVGGIALSCLEAVAHIPRVVGALRDADKDELAQFRSDDTNANKTLPDEFKRLRIRRLEEDRKYYTAFSLSGVGPALRGAVAKAAKAKADQIMAEIKNIEAEPVAFIAVDLEKLATEKYGPAPMRVPAGSTHMPTSTSVLVEEDTFSSKAPARAAAPARRRHRPVM